MTECAKITDNAHLKENVRVSEFATICDDVVLSGHVHVSGHAQVRRLTSLEGQKTITGNVIITSTDEVFCVKLDTIDNGYKHPINHYITYTKPNDMWYHHNFYGNSRELLRSAKTYDKKRFYKQLLKLVDKHYFF